ncbi:MAG: family 10 glycosylhydrolase [Candidatus Azobacteroides sp.]|nr:family 10 glycosylhydrolase [Candidatus Azobacteroides sp.]
MKRHSIFTLIFVWYCLELFAQFPKDEIRAVWLTTNYSLDWPSKPVKNVNDIHEQKNELIGILNRLKEANFNMVFLQTRLRGDVIYPSKIEPVSPFIQSGNNAFANYDPLAFAVEECHKRGLECHAWFVTYPLGPETIRGKENNSPTLQKNRDKMKRHKGEFFLDPGDPQTRTYLISLIEEIVEKYDIDGIHMDYIRYPGADFPDDATFRRYGVGMNKSDWRRENINRFVYDVYDIVKKKKRWVQVSSSVIGMYNYLKESGGKHWTAYSMYQDPERWLQQGKHDFIVPMMYYKDNLFFPFIQDWKARRNGRFVIPGLGIFQLDENESNWSLAKIKEQIQYSRDNHMGGNALYRAQYLLDNKKGILNELMHNYYQHPALLPPLTWLDDVPPLPPAELKAVSSGERLFLSWKPSRQPNNKEVFYNVYRSERLPVNVNDANNLIAARIDSPKLSISIDNFMESGYYYAVTSYDRYHNESKVSNPVYFVTGIYK